PIVPLVGLARIELATSSLSAMRSNRLSYRPLSGTSSNYTSGFAEGQIASLNKVFNLELRLQFSLVAQRLDARRHRQARRPHIAHKCCCGAVELQGLNRFNYLDFVDLLASCRPRPSPPKSSTMEL